MYQSYEFKPEEILVYLRKSRSDDPYLSVEDVLQKHEEIIREWIGRNLVHDIPAKNFYREVVSGETIADRPEFCKVLRQVESPGIKGVLVVEV
ncbi:recombinase family protein, partial [Laedolimicola sp.]|uniref:recombinase family protein n=1 Tax=Laedolimicola sp. TaxID=2981663 RepID=UPI003F7E974F